MRTVAKYPIVGCPICGCCCCDGRGRGSLLLSEYGILRRSAIPRSAGEQHCESEIAKTKMGIETQVARGVAIRQPVMTGSRRGFAADGVSNGSPCRIDSQSATLVVSDDSMHDKVFSIRAIYAPLLRFKCLWVSVREVTNMGFNDGTLAAWASHHESSSSCCEDRSQSQEKDSESR